MNQKLTENDILEKEFKKSKIGGYNKEEVDLFLDEILDDYEFFTKTIVELKKANEILRKENFDIKVKVLKTDRTQMINDEELKAEKNPIEEKLLQLQREIEELKNK